MTAGQAVRAGTGQAVGPSLTVGGLLDEVAGALTSRAEARWLVASAVGASPSGLTLRVEDPVADTTAHAVRAGLARRLSGEPIQYVLGTWAFRNVEVNLDRRVLVPRPETEIVTGVALEELGHRSGGLGSGDQVTAVDLGTGSGVIALSLAAEWDTVVPPGPRPRLEVWATDVSAGALEVFQSNLDLLRGRDAAAADRVRVASGSWFDALPRALRGQVNVIVSNPPYVSAAEWCELDGAVRDHEPKTALVAGPTGLEALETVLVGARRWLAPDGVLVVELAPHQAADLERIATGLGYDAVEVRPDLTGRSRMLIARQPGDRRR